MRQIALARSFHPVSRQVAAHAVGLLDWSMAQSDY
jgi:hypothetical protein